jgi:hypothetical protein
VGGTLTVPLHGSPAEAAVVAVGELGLTTTQLATRRPTLDDIYLRLTGGRLAAA